MHPSDRPHRPKTSNYFLLEFLFSHFNLPNITRHRLLKNVSVLNLWCCCARVLLFCVCVCFMLHVNVASQNECVCVWVHIYLFCAAYFSFSFHAFTLFILMFLFPPFSLCLIFSFVFLFFRRLLGIRRTILRHMGSFRCNVLNGFDPQPLRYFIGSIYSY